MLWANIMFTHHGSDPRIFTIAARTFDKLHGFTFPSAQCVIAVLHQNVKTDFFTLRVTRATVNWPAFNPVVALRSETGGAI